MSQGFAVIDVETTGLVPEKHDRIIEVAVVLLDERGDTEWEWCSLVNPQRDLGPSHIHGISAADVIGAPLFKDVADPLLDALAGRIVVAHNATFDMRFMRYELERAGYPVLTRPNALCSMKWAGRYLGAAKLQHCCEALGIDLSNAHTAMSDARATAALFGWLTQHAADAPEWRSELELVRGYQWPRPLATAPLSSGVTREGTATIRDAHGWLDTIVANTWIEGTEDERSYLVALDSALLDHAVSHHEGLQLVAAAEGCGISPERASQIHREHLDFLAKEAWSDGVLTEDERSGLELVAEALRLAPEDLDLALDRARHDGRPHEHVGEAGAFLRAGDRVVFTGAMDRSRDDWVNLIVNAGLATGGVTKSTRVLVTSDPDSMSGKAAKARKYGVPVIDERTFSRLFAQYLA